MKHSRFTTVCASAYIAGDYGYAPPYEDSLYDTDDNPMFMADMPCGFCGRQHTVYILPK